MFDPTDDDTAMSPNPLRATMTLVIKSESKKLSHVQKRMLSQKKSHRVGSKNTRVKDGSAPFFTAGQK